jgi:hypothetical protein
MTIPNPHAAALRTHWTALNTAIRFTDPELTDEAVLRRQAAMVQTARASLAAATPAAPQTAAAARSDLLATRTRRGASEGREREKVAALRQAGQTLPQVIAAAPAPRIDAILDSVEVLPEVLNASEPEVMATELRDAAFARLVELGEPDALLVVQAEAEDSAAGAWSRTLTEAPVGAVSIVTLTALRAADPAGYSEAFTDRIVVDYSAINRIETMATRV